MKKKVVGNMLPNTNAEKFLCCLSDSGEIGLEVESIMALGSQTEVCATFALHLRRIGVTFELLGEHRGYCPPKIGEPKLGIIR